MASVMEYDCFLSVYGENTALFPCFSVVGPKVEAFHRLVVVRFRKALS